MACRGIYSASIEPTNTLKTEEKVKNRRQNKFRMSYSTLGPWHTIPGANSNLYAYFGRFGPFLVVSDHGCRRVFCSARRALSNGARKSGTIFSPDRSFNLTQLGFNKNIRSSSIVSTSTTMTVWLTATTRKWILGENPANWRRTKWWRCSLLRKLGIFTLFEGLRRFC